MIVLGDFGANFYRNDRGIISKKERVCNEGVDGFANRYELDLSIREQVLLSMKHAEQLQNKWKIEIMELDKDHIHFLIKATPTCIIANIIHLLKQTSTYEIWKNYHDYMSSYYWSGQHHLWTRGYFVSSIGDVSEKTLLEYIKNQG